MSLEPATASQCRDEVKTFSKLTVRHAAVPGRLRVAVRGLKRSPERAGALTELLRLRNRDIDVRANPRTGTVLLRYTPERSAAEILAMIDRALADVAAASTPPVSGAPSPEPWTKTTGAIAAGMRTSRTHGLSAAEVERRRNLYGTNASKPEMRGQWLAKLRAQLVNAPVALLGASAALSAATGARLDALTIGAVVSLNTAIGLATEQRAEQVIRELDRFGAPQCRVRRAGVETLVDAAELVPGDLLVLGRGSFVAADARLVETTELSVNEAALTGESGGVVKDARSVLASTTALADRHNMVFAGTAVMGGSGLAVVTAIGAHTEIGRVQKLAATVAPPATPLQRELDVVGHQLALLFAGFCVLVFLLGVLRGQNVLTMLKLASSIAVAAVPEGLPTVATTTLALGVNKLRRQGILVRHLTAVETLGAIETICLDKTGTLTQNRMTLVAVDVGDGPTTPAAARPEHLRLLEAAVRATELRIEHGAAHDSLDGSGTERAVLEGAKGCGVHAITLFRSLPRVAFMARTERTPFVVSVHQAGPGIPAVAVKGSPQAVLDRASHVAEGEAIRALTEADRTRLVAANEAMGRAGLRVLAVACGARTADVQTGRLTWLGLIGLADPLRPGMVEALARFRRAGATPVMVTGDQSGTAHAIGRELDLSAGSALRVLDTGDISSLDQATLGALAVRTDIFARVSPAQKLDIVQALQASGRVVAMTGDGINDSPALKAADVGVAMGRDGTHAARAVADVVLETDDIGRLAAAMGEGRAIYDNIQRAVDFIVATNLSEIGLTATATILGLPQPLTPVQLLWLNLVSDIFPALGLAADRPARDVLDRPPRSRSATLLSGDRLRVRVREGAVMTIAALVAHAIGTAKHGASPAGRTLTLSTLVVAQLLHAYTVRHQPRPSQGTCGPRNAVLDAAVFGTLALQAAAPFIPGLRLALGIAPPSGRDALTAAALGSGAFVVNTWLKDRAALHRTDRMEIE